MCQHQLLCQHQLFFSCGFTSTESWEPFSLFKFGAQQDDISLLLESKVSKQKYHTRQQQNHNRTLTPEAIQDYTSGEHQQPPACSSDPPAVTT